MVDMSIGFRSEGDAIAFFLDLRKRAIVRDDVGLRPADPLDRKGHQVLDGELIITAENGPGRWLVAPVPEPARECPCGRAATTTMDGIPACEGCRDNYLDAKED